MIAVTTPVASQADLHQSRMSNGVMEMLPVKSLPISAATPIRFSPDGFHVMLMGMRKPLDPGQTFPVTFIFASGTRVTAIVSVHSMTGDGSDETMGSMKMN